jgi:hypothetical protein
MQGRTTTIGHGLGHRIVRRHDLSSVESRGRQVAWSSVRLCGDRSGRPFVVDAIGEARFFPTVRAAVTA